MMPRIKVPSFPDDAQPPPVKKKHVRLKNAFPPNSKKQRLAAKAKQMARKRLSFPHRARRSFREAFGESDDEVGSLFLTFVYR